MITLEGDKLVFRFPGIHAEAGTEINFQRTLRIPDNGKQYPLPSGIGSFPLQHVDDYAERVPCAWCQRGGVMMPIHQAEAMWISFGADQLRSSGYPCAVKIATGKINAVSGKPWSPELDPSQQDYIVVPGQRWLDGYAVANNVVRQFVAMPLGAGYSAEEQSTGRAEYGGLQIVVYPMKVARYARILEAEAIMSEFMSEVLCALAKPLSEELAMGLAAGGRMRQQVYADPYGYDAWDTRVSRRCFVTLVNALHWSQITGVAPPTKPPTAADYNRAGLPWFDHYREAQTLEGASELTALKSVTEMAVARGEDPIADQDFLEPAYVVKLDPQASQKTRAVRESGI